MIHLTGTLAEKMLKFSGREATRLLWMSFLTKLACLYRLHDLVLSYPCNATPHLCWCDGQRWGLRVCAWGGWRLPQEQSMPPHVGSNFDGHPACIVRECVLLATAPLSGRVYPTVAQDQQELVRKTKGNRKNHNTDILIASVKHWLQFNLNKYYFFHCIYGKWQKRGK